MICILRLSEALEQHSAKDRIGMPLGDKPLKDESEDSSERGAKPRRLKVSEMLGGEREAILEHGGQDYRLRITASGKLILTK
jgi:hemin uptake protein HemP